ncbi:MAG TPA: hypothetical protein VE820_09225 [Sphingomicrobium sp.]|nr:hypothetical protein [Sphingomicrobium sp.]
MRSAVWIFAVVLSLSACSSPGGPYPSLQPRSAEKIDPRIEPASPINDRPAASALTSQLAALVEQARAGDDAFEPAAANAERLSAVAGAAQSESWIAAQQALSAAIAARRPTALAQADIDTLAAKALQTQGGIAPNDLKAIDAAAAEVSTISGRQTDRIAAMQHRLGL